MDILGSLQRMVGNTAPRGNRLGVPSLQVISSQLKSLGMPYPGPITQRFDTLDPQTASQLRDLLHRDGTNAIRPILQRVAPDVSRGAAPYFEKPGGIWTLHNLLAGAIPPTFPVDPGYTRPWAGTRTGRGGNF